MNIAVSVSSKIDFVNFRSLTSSEIRALSVKRIQNELTLDTLLHPTPGGLYDPALGAWEDNLCTTCNLRKFACPGHPGHIELPVVVYHPTYIDQLLKLMNAQCAYCGGFTLAKGEALRMKCKLRLLRYGLIQEFHEFDMLDGRNPDAVEKSDTKDEVVEEDFRTLDDDVPSKPGKEDKAKYLFSQTKSRIAFVNSAVKRAKAQIQAGTFVETEKHEAVYAARRDFVKECIAVLSASRACGACLIKSPRFRKDGYNKIFRKPLSGRDLAKVMQAGRERLNALTSVKLAKEKARQQRQQDREVDEAISMNDTTDSQESGSEFEETTQAGKTTKKSQTNTAPASGTPEYMTPQEVYATMTMLFEKEGELLSYIYDSEYGAKRSSTVRADMLFIKDLLVPPNKYRPVAMASGQVTEAQQNSLYKKILKSCDQLQDIQRELAGLQEANGRYRKRTFDDFKRGWITLQDNVNSLIDTDRNPMKARMKLFTEEGIKQKLEKKEGLFRQNMMGKRVNFAARSVISPDVNLEPNEIGVPPVFAKKLTFPEPVTDHNFKELREAVLNGVEKWPGAAAIENENGQVINLRLKNFEERQALANQLMTPSNPTSNGSTNKKVHRHLANGDFVIMNRQPTLHKPSMMTHKVRVLPGEKTIRMHYANCKAYNADFDGDEMNMHFPQNEIARAEAMQLSNTDSQYLVATFGEPLRGLIQDHLSMGVWLCNKDTFFKRGDYYQLIYAALRADDSRHFKEKIKTVPPAILKPYPMWTGKQLVSTVLLNVTPEFQEPLNMSNKSKVKASYWSADGKSEEAMVLVQEGELMHGILDKSHLGPAENGFIHAIYEAYGKAITTKSLGIIGRLLTKMLHMKAFSCGMEDITLTEEGDKLRRGIIENKKSSGHEVAAKFVLLEPTVSTHNKELDRRLEEALRDDQKQSLLDTLCKVAGGEITTEITRTCLPKTLWKHFPKNQMQNMTVSGAKGSDVNANLISCSLGQQVLEGRRVPVMASGKTLPSFKPFETMLRAGGYVTNRFLSGVQPQEYYFHTMGGREGLIDTAVKTSRSGYLQRCVIKGMEGLKVQYDTSVRDIDGGVVQFLYGEDGLDITRQKNLTNFKFNAQNFLTLLRGMPAGEQLLKFFSEDARELNAKNFKNIQKGRLDKLQDPVTTTYNPANTGGSVSETFYGKLRKYLEKNPEKLIKDKKTAPKGQIAKANFTHLLELKYMQSLVDPGEAVGVIAGQSIGEPSTQMTLNTFHLAGVSGKNVTLGIPRLREIVMTASSNISTPNMSLYLNPGLEDEQAQLFSKGISRLTLAETLETVKVKTSIGKNALGDHARLYSVRLNTYPAPEYRETYGITTEDVFRTICVRFVPNLLKKIKRQFQEKGAAKYAKMDIGKSKGKTKMGDGDVDGDDGDDDAPEMGDGGLVDDVADEATDDEVDSEVDEDNDDGKPSGRAGAYGLDEEETEAIRQAHDAAEVDVDSDNEAPNARAVRAEQENNEDNDREEVRRSKKASFDKVRDIALRLYQNLRRLEFDHKTGETCVLDFEFDIQSPKILMLNLAEVSCKETVIQDVPGVKASFVAMETIHDENGKEKQIPCITTEGINIPEMRNYQHIINPHKIFTNDIAAVLKYYGVEACRASIIRETGAIFKGHGIDVDDRHLILVADTMTRGGGFAAFSRIGMKHAVSPFSKMSFETTVGFMKEAVLDNDWDDLSGPSARIVMGQPSCVGTGAFDVFTQMT